MNHLSPVSLWVPILAPFGSPLVAIQRRYPAPRERQQSGAYQADSHKASRSAWGRFLPVATLLSDRQLLGESRHSSKEFICSVRPSLNDRYRLRAALHRSMKSSP